MYKKWSLSKKAKKEFAQNMQNITDFCNKNDISYSNSLDSFYFTIDNKTYRVSNHSVKKSNESAICKNIFSEKYGLKTRSLYHIAKYDYEILASKTRIVKIYEDLKSGKILDKRGNEVKYNDKI